MGIRRRYLLVVGLSRLVLNLSLLLIHLDPEQIGQGEKDAVCPSNINRSGKMVCGKCILCTNEKLSFILGSPSFNQSSFALL